MRRRSLDIGSRRSPRLPGRGRRRRGFGAGGCGRRLRCGGHGRGAGGLGRRDGSGGSGRRCRNGFRRPGGRFEMGEHVALGDPAVPAGAGNRRRIESVLVHEPAYRRTQALGSRRRGLVRRLRAPRRGRRMLRWRESRRHPRRPRPDRFGPAPPGSARCPRCASVPRRAPRLRALAPRAPPCRFRARSGSRPSRPRRPAACATPAAWRPGRTRRAPAPSRRRSLGNLLGHS